MNLSLLYLVRASPYSAYSLKFLENIPTKCLKALEYISLIEPNEELLSKEGANESIEETFNKLNTVSDSIYR